jgi:GT2 family glycosyltransferase
MSENLPLVTINILSFNRRDELRHTLTKVYEQDYKNIEVIVVDNASTDGSPEMVEKEFPNVILIKLDKNIGIAGWNKGFEIAKGEYVLVLDDDAYPEESCIIKMINLFSADKTVGAIAINVLYFYSELKILEPFPGGWLPNLERKEGYWPLLLGCAFAIKKNIVTKWAFNNNFFICSHELPIILSICLHKNKIYFSNNIRATHVQKSKKKKSSLREYYHFRNQLNFVFWHFNYPSCLLLSLRIALFYFTRSLRHRWFRDYLIALASISNDLAMSKGQRLSKETTKEILATGIIEFRYLEKFKKLLI